MHVAYYLLANVDKQLVAPFYRCTDSRNSGEKRSPKILLLEDSKVLTIYHG